MTKSDMKNRILFLDRDGIICEAVEHGKYLTKPQELVLMPGIRDIINIAKDMGYLVVILTNQSAIAKGLITEKTLDEIHSKIQALLGNKIDKIYHCPHAKTDRCNCRKPKPGMILRAIKDLNVDVGKSIIVGDKDTDILAGQTVGCRTVFLDSPIHGHRIKMCNPDKVIKELSELLMIL